MTQEDIWRARVLHFKKFRLDRDISVCFPRLRKRQRKVMKRVNILILLMLEGRLPSVLSSCCMLV